MLKNLPVPFKKNMLKRYCAAKSKEPKFFNCLSIPEPELRITAPAKAPAPDLSIYYRIEEFL